MPNDPAQASTGPESHSEPHKADPSDSGIGRSYVGAFAATAMLLTLLAVMAVSVYCLIAVWPPSGTAPSRSTIFGATLSTSRDQQLFIITGISGVIGGLIHSVRSLYWYIGNRVLRRS